ncbi:MAG: SGNH/GDSL hydrolase family protein [Lachnospiraceae bacterium]|nr:SGNH/GDSL hydrolase family protein [Lachnospiraceae bacterium]
MKRSYLTYLLFIIAMTLFVILRINAGKALAAENVQADTEPVAAAGTVPTKAPSETEPGPEETVTPAPADENEYLYRGEVEPLSEYDGVNPRIVCWGDSLTVSLDNASAYPDILRQLSGCEVINYGVEMDSAAMIAMREGGLRVNVKATVIPADTNLIPVFLRTEDNGHVRFLDNGDGGVNPCSISGIEGELSKLNGSYYFKRSRKGERLSIDEGTQFKTFGMNDAREGDVLVIFAGTNDLPDAKSVQQIIKLEQAMLEAASCSRYVIVGLTYAGGIPQIDEVNEAMHEAFGDNFLDIRKYMLTYGLDDAGITPTAQDEEDIAKGEIPSSLRSDYVHGNKHYHRLLGQQLYRRMCYLGYLEEKK